MMSTDVSQNRGARARVLAANRQADVSRQAWQGHVRKVAPRTLRQLQEAGRALKAAGF